ncbi:MAG: hypothetical protein M1819_002061 [Sarea resinae]|nr:MAG: hypothetical protein M1819_002061 [Sarea resinae]
MTVLVAHETVPGTEVYGPGTFIDKKVVPVPEDTRRIFEWIASNTPGFTQDRTIWDTIHFEGNPEPMIPGPIKAPSVAASLHAMCGVVANEILELRHGQPLAKSSVSINTDQAGIWLGSVFTSYIQGSDVSALFRSGKLADLFERNWEKGFGRGIASRATALYQTKDPGVWYQLHGSLDAEKALSSMGIDTNVTFDTLQGYYDYVQEQVLKWGPDELEMHNVRNGLCGSICYTPEGWRKTEMGKQLRKHPLVNYTHETYAIPTPKVPWPKVPSDSRPLAGVKVLEMVRIIAGPCIGTILAAFGADVIRVNSSDLADLNVRCPVASFSSRMLTSQVLQLVLNAGKRTIDLDIKKPEDFARLQELLQDVDIFVQGFRYGSFDRKGLGLRHLLELAGKRGKGIIYVDENTYGPDGPFAERPGWQQIGDAASGSSYIIGRSQGHPHGKSILPPLPISDMTTGLVGALGAMMALRDRATKGGSYHIVSSLVSADAIALEPEVGLYPLDQVQKTAEKFEFVPTDPGQFVSEILANVCDGWKKGLPGYLDEDSPLMTHYSDGPWAPQTILKPVVRLGDEKATPRWSSAPVPNCHHDRNITWL